MISQEKQEENSLVISGFNCFMLPSPRKKRTRGKVSDDGDNTVTINTDVFACVLQLSTKCFIGYVYKPIDKIDVMILDYVLLKSFLEQLSLSMPHMLSNV